MALVLGLATIFGAAASANAQSKFSFETSFDFHVGKEKLAAGKYELQKMDYNKYLLRSADTKETRIVYFEITEANDSSAAPQRIAFNRYGENYFLRSVFEKPGAEGKQMLESKLERQIRKGGATKEDQLAGGKTKPEKVSVNLNN